MSQVMERKAREFILLEDNDEIAALIQTRIGARTIFIKNPSEKIPVSIREYQPDNTLDLITEPEFEPAGKTLTVYALLDRYIEIDLEIEQKIDAGMFHCRITRIRKAAQGRASLRLKITAGTAVATNFRVSRQSLELGVFTIPTSIKVVLDQFQSANARMSDIVKVDIFRGEDDILIKNVKKTMKTVFIPDTSKAEGYSPAGNEFLDCAGVYGAELKKIMQKNVEKTHKSVLIMPILYIDDSEKTIPFGYIQLISKSAPLTMETVSRTREHSIKLVERIRDANTALITTDQEIADISRNGVRLTISDNELKKLLAKASGFIFDIVFKLQAPVTIYGEIRFSHTDSEGNLFTGVEFMGNSSRENEMRRFYSYIEPLENEYKLKLKKAMNKS